MSLPCFDRDSTTFVLQNQGILKNQILTLRVQDAAEWCSSSCILLAMCTDVCTHMYIYIYINTYICIHIRVDLIHHQGHLYHVYMYT